MTPTALQAQIIARRLSINHHGLERLAFNMDEGGCYRVITSDTATLDALLCALEPCPGTLVLPASGGLLGGLTVAENYQLALAAAGESGVSATAQGRLDRAWDESLQHAFELCGMPPDRIAAIGRERPMNLGRLERWQAGFVRCLVRPPELLVFDRIFAGLSRRDVDAVIAMEDVYHRLHPFRSTLLVDLDAHELPAVAGCRSQVHLLEAACPC